MEVKLLALLENQADQPTDGQIGSLQGTLITNDYESSIISIYIMLPSIPMTMSFKILKHL